LKKSLPLTLALCSVLIALHAPLLSLPYFWDEAGYYIPAARDLLLIGSLLPHSVAASAHPPLVPASIALAWKLTRFSPVATRIVMLAWAALALTGLFALARRISNDTVAFATVALTAVYPVFFSQSAMAQLDMAVAALIFWGLDSYFGTVRFRSAVFFSLAVLAKETAIITPLAILLWEAISNRWCPTFAPRSSPARSRGNDSPHPDKPSGSPLADYAALLFPLLPLALWLLYVRLHTGHLFGDPAFTSYNLGATLSPARFLFALPQRLWHALGHMNLYVLTIATALAMMFPPAPSESRQAGISPFRHPLAEAEDSERPRIAIPTQFAFAAVILAHVVAFSLVGGALLARYMLPVVPLVILICVSTLWRRLPYWPAAIALVAACFVLALFVNPPYRFAPEDNLAWRDFVVLHEDAARHFQRPNYNPRVLTAWPASDELTRPYLGYVPWPARVLRIENFTLEELEAAAQRNDWDVALVFSTKYEPPRGSLLDRWEFWRRAHQRWFDYHRDLPPALAAQVLAGRLTWQESRGGQWIAIIEINRLVNARNDAPRINADER